MKTKLTLTAAVALVLTTISVYSQVIFSDNFNAYTSWNTGSVTATKMSSNWTFLGNAPVISIGTGTDTLSSTNYAVLNNSVAVASLGTTVTQDFSLTYKVLPSAYNRITWAGLFNSAGTQGYVLYWDSSSSTNNLSQGAVTIREYNSATALTAFNTSFTTTLTTTTYSGHNPGGTHTTDAALSAPMAQMELAWSSSTNTLSIYVDGLLRSSVVNADLTSFSKVYLAGNGSTPYEDIVVTVVPEPTSMALLIGSASLLFVGANKRRRAYEKEV